MKVFPAILTNNPSELVDMLDAAEGSAKTVQIDIIDGQFVNNKTIDPTALSSLTYGFNYDFHLMVNEPVKWVEKSFQAGAERIIGQIELMGDQLEFLARVHALEAKAGLAVDYDTELGELEPDVFSEVDVVLVMGYPAGFGGQDFRSGALDKIAELAAIRAKREIDFQICVDGGVTKGNTAAIAKAGADEVAVGKRIFDGDIASNIQSYQDAAQG